MHRPCLMSGSKSDCCCYVVIRSPGEISAVAFDIGIGADASS